MGENELGLTEYAWSVTHDHLSRNHTIHPGYLPASLDTPRGVLKTVARARASQLLNAIDDLRIEGSLKCGAAWRKAVVREIQREVGRYAQALESATPLDQVQVDAWIAHAWKESAQASRVPD